jgi:hypothetical protein
METLESQLRQQIRDMDQAVSDLLAGNTDAIEYTLPTGTKVRMVLGWNTTERAQLEERLQLVVAECGAYREQLALRDAGGVDDALSELERLRQTYADARAAVKRLARELTSDQISHTDCANAILALDEELPR